MAKKNFDNRQESGQLFLQGIVIRYFLIIED